MEKLVRQLGELIGATLLKGVEAGMRPAKVKTRIVKLKVAGIKGACGVPGCLGKQAAKGVCPNHYNKARRMKMSEPYDLNELARDGRKRTA